ncbi:MAG: ribonuclease E/G [Geminicoccaceae bacterium]
MSRDLIVEQTPFGAKAALLRHGELLEIRFADKDASDMRGQIFLARVRSIDSELDAAFIDCGHGQVAYLSGRDGRWSTGKRRDDALARQLTEGQSVLVQGTGGSSRDGKKPRVTSDIQLAGMYLIYRPRRGSTKLSSRLADTGQSDRLRELARELFPEGGLIFRGAAGEAKEEDVVAEGERLKELWKDLEAKADTTKAPACLFERKDPLHRILHEALRPDLDQIITNDRVTMVAARTYLETWLPGMAQRLDCVPGAFEVNGVNEQLEKGLVPKIELDGGGSIVIESTEALTAIDVNSAGRRALDTNLEAAREIARQLRLQRIGGTIVVDFIDLSSRTEREQLMTTLKKSFAGDPASVQLFPPTPLGLVQISRQRLGLSLAERLHRHCPTCAGSGTVTSLRAAAERLLGELSEQPKGRAKIEIRVSVDLYGYIANDIAEPFREFVARHGVLPATLKPDEAMQPGAYRIIGADGV